MKMSSGTNSEICVKPFRNSRPDRRRRRSRQTCHGNLRTGRSQFGNVAPKGSGETSLRSILGGYSLPESERINPAGFHGLLFSCCIFVKWIFLLIRHFPQRAAPTASVRPLRDCLIVFLIYWFASPFFIPSRFRQGTNFI